MAKILVEDDWYEEISSASLYETEFEAVVKQEAARLFPGYHFVAFKQTVYAEGEGAKADFALIEEEYRGWWVGEVEMAHHSFSGHVLPQVKTLTDAAYGETEARVLCEENPVLELGKMLDLMKGKPPRVLVVVNTPVTGWTDPLRAHDALLAIVQIFRSFRNKYVIRLNGESPVDRKEILTTCECDGLLSRFLVIHSPARLPVRPKARVILRFNNQLTEWDRLDLHDRVYLTAVRHQPLAKGVVYEILSLADGSFEIRPTESSKRR